MSSFALTAWIANVVILVTLSTSLSIISCVTRHIGYEHEPVFSLTKCLLMSLRIFCAQGWKRLPSSLPGRVVVISSLFTGFILNSLFVLQLQAGLSSKQSPLPFTGLEQLANSDYMIYTDPLGVPHADIDKGETKVMRKLKTMLRNYDDEEGGHIPVNETCLEKIAVITATQYVDLYIDRFACPIIDTKVDLYFQWASFPTSIKSRFKKVIDNRIRRIVEVGIVARSVSNSVLKKKVPPQKYTFEVIELTQVKEFFVLYAVALATSLLIFLLELIFAKVISIQTGSGSFVANEYLD